MKLDGRAHVFGRDIDTDAIIAARYLNTSDPAQLAAHCMEDIDKTFAVRVNPGDVIVAGENFGCGSSREHAPIAIRAAGISAVVAASFGRIFYRNAINIGLPILECPEAAASIRPGDTVHIDTDRGIIEDKATGTVFRAEPFPAFVSEIIEAGGLVERTKRVLEEGR
ncbi:MAG: 3-isopropylmalate dehydratase small subunit [Coriobacteriales bacterium]|jgi:3-isopropylmalate/(R)-2-methylmalate dehydratase small subunit